MIRVGICPLCPQVYIGIVSRSAPLLLALPALAGFFDLSHVFDGPLRYGASVRFETMPSSPMRQTCSNTVGPSPVRCSTNWMERRLALPTLARPRAEDLFCCSAHGFFIDRQTGTLGTGFELIDCSNVEGDVMSERRRIKHTATFEQRLANEAERIKTEAKELPQGKEREDMMRKARQAETACQISAWLFSPGLQKPT